MRLSKKQRASLREMFGGRCAYCGCELGERWHADHVESVQRKLEHVPGKGFLPTGEVWRPEYDTLENLVPACAPCNIDKSVFSIEDWRRGLQRTHEVLRNNASRYRHGLRFGLIVENTKPVVFYFESFRAAASLPPKEPTE